MKNIMSPVVRTVYSQQDGLVMRSSGWSVELGFRMPTFLGKELNNEST
jgi:hypothetical protein